MHRPIQHRALFAAMILAAIVAFQSVGWLLAWQGLQFEARLEAQRVLFQGVNALQTNIFQQDFFKKIKANEGEIRLNGQLFDYRILSETDDSVRVALYYDQEEQALLAALGQVFESGDDAKTPSSTPLALWLAKWLGSAFLVPEKALVSSSITPRLQGQNFTTLSFTAQSAPSVFAPPPEL